MEELDQNLACGEFVGQLKIESVLGMGGFGVTYKAIDPDLEKYFAVKEYLPSDLTVRNADSKSLQPKTGRSADFKYGLERFLDEAKTLAKFNHANICQVTQFVQANNTAYLVMNYEPGEALDDYLKRINFRGQMPELEILSIIKPILNGLAAVHKEGLLHRDIKPGNIYLRQNGEPMLIDFGAARYALGEQSKSISAIVSMGYAPPEQYTSRGKQGEWTDLYAVGAVIYGLITGKAPIESPDRREALANEEDDPLLAAELAGKGRYSENLLEAVDWCLSLSYKQRPQSAGALLQVLAGDKTPFAQAEASAQQQTQQSTGTRRLREEERFEATTGKQKKAKVARASGDSTSPKRKNLLLAIGSIVVSCLGLAGLWWFISLQPPINVELEDYQLARINGDIESYEKYLRDWPEGEYSVQIRSLLESKKAAQSVRREKILGLQQLFKQINFPIDETGQWDEQTIAVVGEFQQQQGIAVNTKASTALLDELKQQLEAEILVQATQQRDREAHLLAVSTDTVKAYQTYLDDYPSGQFRSAVKTLLDQRNKANATAQINRQRVARLKQRQAAEQAAKARAAAANAANATAKQPKPIVAIQPRYPVKAARDGVEGYVEVRFSINEIGGVADAIIIDSQPKRIFDREALRAIRKFKFRPSVINGQAAKVANMHYRFDFKLR